MPGRQLIFVWLILAPLLQAVGAAADARASHQGRAGDREEQVDVLRMPPPPRPPALLPCGAHPLPHPVMSCPRRGAAGGDCTVHLLFLLSPLHTRARGPVIDCHDYSTKIEKQRLASFRLSVRCPHPSPRPRPCLVPVFICWRPGAFTPLPLPHFSTT